MDRLGLHVVVVLTSLALAGCVEDPSADSPSVTELRINGSACTEVLVAAEWSEANTAECDLRWFNLHLAGTDTAGEPVDVIVSLPAVGDTRPQGTFDFRTYDVRCDPSSPKVGPVVAVALDGQLVPQSISGGQMTLDFGVQHEVFRGHIEGLRLGNNGVQVEARFDQKLVLP